MTDRVRTLTVTLEEDHRVDDIQEIMHAIGMVRGVASIDLGSVVTSSDRVVRNTYRHDIGFLIADVAVAQDAEFLTSVRAAHAELRQRRGY